MKPIRSCDIISADWNCSSGISQHSVCVRECLSDFRSESIKCKCKQNICQWVEKGRSCTWTRRFPSDHSSENISSERFSSNDYHGIEYVETTSQTEKHLTDSELQVNDHKPSEDTFFVHFDKTDMKAEIDYSSEPKRQRPVESIFSEMNENQNEDFLTQFLRDINVNGHMVFNVNNNYNYNYKML